MEFRRLRTRVALVAIICAALAALPARLAHAAADDNPCAGRGPMILVDTRDHRMYLCARGATLARYRIAIGRGGPGKRIAGDGKTPLGRYRLGRPRASVKVHTFIPVDYPTAAQRRQGYGGGDIGIHGPERRSRLLGDATTWVDWTRGCIAVGSDAAIDQIAAWVRRARVELVEIVDGLAPR